jgi:hypothetical protein
MNEINYYFLDCHLKLSFFFSHTKLNKNKVISWVKFHFLYPKFMVFNTTFTNISVILWQSVLLVEESVGPKENHRPVASHWQTLSHNVVSSTPCMSGIQNS